MESQKLEDLLLLSLNADEKEREESEMLATGYDRRTGRWELIIKYNGPAEGLAGENIVVEPLLGGYAIVTLPEKMIAEFIKSPQVEYVEMPKKLYTQEVDGRRQCCVLELMSKPPYLDGVGVIVGMIDSGIDIFHEEFRKEDGSTRLLGLWDQTAGAGQQERYGAPEGFSYGAYYSREVINEFLRGEEEGAAPPGYDASGHGTAVASVAAGSRIGIARNSPLLVVKLGQPLGGTYPRTTQLMRAVQFLVVTAQKLSQPIAINISFGNCYGDHRGGSLLERFLDGASEIGRNTIIVGSGNETFSRGHFAGSLQGRGRQQIEFSVGAYETSLNLQLWKNYQDDFRVRLRSPDGKMLEVRERSSGVMRAAFGGTDLLCYIGQPTPYSPMQEYYFDFLPQKDYITAGVWRIEAEAVRVRNGRFDLYLPSYSVRGEETGFYEAAPYGTLTVPSAARSVITVGAYEPQYGVYAEFSGRGFEGVGTYGDANANKPDLSAPGVEVRGAAAGGGYASFTGTSFAAPYAAGCAALMMEWGIVRGNDRYLYGQKCKAYLTGGARQLSGEAFFPNAKTGWGALCLRGSLPE